MGGVVGRIPGFRDLGAHAAVTTRRVGVAGSQGARFTPAAPRIGGRGGPATPGYPAGNRQNAALRINSADDAIGTGVSNTALRGIASPAFARRMVITILVVMLGCGLVLGLTHAVPWMSASNGDPSPQLPLDTSNSVEVQAPAPRDSRADIKPQAAPAGLVQSIPNPGLAPAAATPNPVQPVPMPSDSAMASPQPAAQEHSNGSTLDAPADIAAPEAVQAPVADTPAPAADKKTASKKTSAPKAASKKATAKRAATQDRASVEVLSPSTGTDITSPW